MANRWIGRSLMVVAALLMLSAVIFVPTSANSAQLNGGTYYKIIAKHSSKCLDVYQSSTDDEVNVQQYQCTGNNNQIWRIEVAD